MQGVSDRHAWRAALGSLLDISVENLPDFEGLSADMQWTAWLGSRLNLGIWSFPPGATFPPGYWLLVIASPYPGYDLHTLVMRGGNVAYDPHPEPQDLSRLPPEQMRVGQMLMPLDPSEPSGRFVAGD